MNEQEFWERAFLAAITGISARETNAVSASNPDLLVNAAKEIADLALERWTRSGPLLER